MGMLMCAHCQHIPRCDINMPTIRGNYSQDKACIRAFSPYSLSLSQASNQVHMNLVYNWLWQPRSIRRVDNGMV